jgi:hypothetical protein
LIPDGVIGIFQWHNPSDRAVALGSTEPLTEMSSRSLPAGKCGRCIGLTTLPQSCAVVMKSGNLKKKKRKFCTRCAVTFFRNFKMMKRSQPKLFLVMKQFPSLQACWLP